MADVRLNPVFEAFKKQIGDLVFYEYNRKTRVRRKGIPKNTKTAKQVLVRNSLAELVSDWASMSEIFNIQQYLQITCIQACSPLPAL